MFLSFFHPETRRVFRGKRGEASPFGHMFGGAVDYTGLTAYEGQPAVHLLFRLNTADPAIGVTVPGVQWLPLLCAIRYGACDLAYRVVSDSQVKILRQSETKPWDHFPFDEYPANLSPQPIAIEEGTYDPSKVQDALFYAGVFGYGALSPKQYAKLIRYVEEQNLPELFGWESAEAYLEEGHASPFAQGRPTDDCSDPDCPNHGKRSSLRPFAIFQEERREARNLWGPNGENLQIIYQVCPECAAIHTSNQCT